MISRLRPIDVSISFDDREYRLGETIDVTIEMTPNRECRVREGHVDLILEERWTERSTLTIEKPVFSSGGGALRYGPPQQVGTTTETREISKDHKETSVHGSTVFLDNAQLKPGWPSRHHVTVQIQPEAPAHAGESKTRWWLQTVIDVAGARDIKPRHKVKISATQAGGS